MPPGAIVFLRHRCPWKVEVGCTPYSARPVAYILLEEGDPT